MCHGHLRRLRGRVSTRMNQTIYTGLCSQQTTQRHIPTCTFGGCKRLAQAIRCSERGPIIPSCDDLLPALNTAQDAVPSGWFLEQDGERRKTTTLFLERNHLGCVFSHTFIHTLVTKSAQAGDEMSNISNALDNTVGTVVKSYAHLSTQHPRGSFKKVKAVDTRVTAPIYENLQTKRLRHNACKTHSAL